MNINDSSGPLDQPSTHGTLSANFGRGPVQITYRDADAERRSTQVLESDLSLDMQSLAEQAKAALRELDLYQDENGNPRLDYLGRPMVRELALARQKAALAQAQIDHQRALDAQLAAERSAKTAQSAAFDREAQAIARLAGFRQYVRQELSARGVAKAEVDEIVASLTLADAEQWGF
ncbi:MAG TPA: hypothetical protein VF322_03890 [Gammaproteobacteria bacterium]